MKAFLFVLLVVAVMNVPRSEAGASGSTPNSKAEESLPAFDKQSSIEPSTIRSSPGDGTELPASDPDPDYYGVEFGAHGLEKNDLSLRMDTELWNGIHKWLCEMVSADGRTNLNGWKAKLWNNVPSVEEWRRMTLNWSSNQLRPDGGLRLVKLCVEDQNVDACMRFYFENHLPSSSNCPVPDSMRRSSFKFSMASVHSVSPVVIAMYKQGSGLLKWLLKQYMADDNTVYDYAEWLYGLSGVLERGDMDVAKAILPKLTLGRFGFIKFLNDAVVSDNADIVRLVIKYNPYYKFSNVHPDPTRRLRWASSRNLSRVLSDITHPYKGLESEEMDYSPIMTAAAMCHIGALSELLEMSLEISEQTFLDWDRYTAKGATQLRTMIEEAKTDDGQTALDLARERECVEAQELFRKYGVTA